MDQYESVKRALDAWKQGRDSVADIRSLAADLGNQHYAQGIPGLLELLNHEDEIVRYNAVMSLAFEFHYTSIVETLVTMLEQDPDEDCRRVAAGALGTLSQNTKAQNVLKALAAAALNDSDEYVRSSAYTALRIVNGVSREEHLQLLRDQSLDVDPIYVRAILSELA